MSDSLIEEVSSSAIDSMPLLQSLIEGSTARSSAGKVIPASPDVVKATSAAIDWSFNYYSEKIDDHDKAIKGIEKRLSRIERDVIPRIEQHDRSVEEAIRLSKKAVTAEGDLRTSFLFGIKGAVKDAWKSLNAPTDYPAQGLVLVYYALSNNPLQEITVEQIEVLRSVLERLLKPDIDSQVIRAYRRRIREAGLELRGEATYLSTDV